MSLVGIPAHLLAQAAALPENRGAAQTLLRAASQAPGLPIPSSRDEGAQGATGGARETLTMVLPLPPKELSPNARVHWAKKARAVKEYRALADNEAFCACIAASIFVSEWEAATVRATFYFKDRRRRDADNLLAMLKPAFDGLADARVIANDSGLTHLPVRIEVDRERPRVELTIAASGRL